MSFTRTKTQMLSRLLSLALLLSTMLATSLRATADDLTHQKCWTTVGSTGTVDEADRDKLVFQGVTVAFPEILPPLPNVELSAQAQTVPNALVFPPQETTTATVRYNVVATDGLLQYGDHVGMTVRFRDDGDRARVFARLIEVDHFNGATVTRLTFDSNAFTAANNHQTQGVGANFAFDFSQKAYYIEVTLTKISSPIVVFGGGRPGLAAIRLCRAYVIN
jgi:hypothetical protein